MKNKLFTLAAALMLAAVLGGVYAAPALAAAVKAVLVKNVDEPGRAPFQFNSSCTNVPGFCIVNLPAVPMDKRLVIQNINAVVTMSNSATFGSIDLTSPNSVASFTGNVVFSGVISRYAVNGFLHQYFETGVAPVLTISATSFDTMSTNFTVTGYFVDTTI